jgi:hypothetical protein
MKRFKKRNIIIFSLFALSSISIYSQDLIVTNEGDSLNCKITKITENAIYFTFKYKDEIRSTLLPTNQVKHYQQDYYQTSIVPAEKIVSREIYPHFRAAINGGLSYRTAKLSEDIPSDFDQYFRDLNSGGNYGFSLSYFFSEYLGLGFQYDVYRSKNETDLVYVTPPGGPTRGGPMSDNITINFIGPSFSTRLLDRNKKNSFLVNLSIGYMGYKNSAVLITDYLIKGSTLGWDWDIGYDIRIAENWAIGFQLSYKGGYITEYELSDGNDTKTVKLEMGHYESLYRIDLSLGIRFSK